MSQELRQLLQETVARAAIDLRNLPEAVATASRQPGKWTRKEELGHLIDSASNNHVRFIRAALHGEFQGPGYDQTGWIKMHGYAEMPWSELIDFWERYNRMLARVIERIPAGRLEARCVIGEHPPTTLHLLIEDYVRHMQHHLDHILGRPEVPS